MTQTDDEILRRVQGGDREAFLALFDRYYSRVEGYARRRMQNPEAARDIASETFLRAYRTVDSFRLGEISYAGYLFLICRRLMLTERARYGGALFRSLDEHTEEIEAIPDGVALPLDLLLTAERCTMLRNALDTFPLRIVRSSTWRSSGIYRVATSARYLRNPLSARSHRICIERSRS